ncbi:hypothetical protein UNSWDHB_1608 [Dehalobacter sp. UNSWDHB]|uniref:hypothetical protein n=1 Tax=unclassified Dehalobacter TaxID=2635733 RepID=UPI00028AAE78|nr:MULTISPECIES: hypothetical protein [unclassified Dehalobacter]AFV02759.1 hypothetical protein DHBDCA_p1733 [Dehalobacter sp. DCA]AFV05744.1 hypothetical protein DCF50_p1742 [Dehalobacter sp. CF]EQB21073.1 hypothetical protein UNSWDHB_1608 [Dehalobacter sp. UNSWDHB]
MVFELLLALSLRFFLFDFVLFKKIRDALKQKGYFFCKLFGCPFCQGFWCGLAVFLYYHSLQPDLQQFIAFLGFGFISAYLGLVSAVIIDPLIQRYERNTGIPLQ